MAPAPFCFREAFNNLARKELIGRSIFRLRIIFFVKLCRDGVFHFFEFLFSGGFAFFPKLFAGFFLQFFFQFCCFFQFGNDFFFGETDDFGIEFGERRVEGAGILFVHKND